MLALAVSAMASHQNIWLCYFMDFIAHKLMLVDPSHVPQGDIAQQFLHTYFDHFEHLHSREMPQRLVQLHCYASIHHLSLAQMATTLRPLSKIEGVRS